ncbi:MAG: DegT/DnrJ/EryC1/StrS family aminotransferase [Solirubrobacteraceae bacterium]
MSDWVVPLSDVRLSASEIEAVMRVYQSGWLSQGPRVAAFEAAFADWLGGGEATAVCSGTAALSLIWAVIGLRQGDEVVLPSLTFAAAAATVVQAGARPVFADIDALERPWVSMATVRDRLSERTRAIVTLPYAGAAGAATELRQLADDHGILLVEDAAHALGARGAGGVCGRIGHLAAFSFFANKNLTLGEGGMVMCEDAGLAARARLLRSHGMSSGTWQRHTGPVGDYEVLEPGFNYRLDEPRAALGTALLARLAADNERRAQIAGRYHAALEAMNGVDAVLGERAGEKHAWHIYPLLLDPRLDRAAVRGRLHRAGVQTSIHYPPLHMSRAFADSPPVCLAVTEDYCSRTLTIPLFPHMTDAQCELVIHSIKTSLLS